MGKLIPLAVFVGKTQSRVVQKGSLISVIEMQTEAVAAVVQLPFHIRQEMKRGLTKSCSRPVC